MKKITTLAVDDEGPALRRLEKMVNQHSQLQLVGLAANGQEALHLIRNERPELLLLDIQLKDQLAFELLAKAESYFNGQAIFITAHDEYAIRAFEAQAVDYLLKPYTQDRFHKAVERAGGLINNKQPLGIGRLIASMEQAARKEKTVRIPEGNKIHFFRSEELQYVRSEGYHCEFHLETESYHLIRITLKETLRHLPEQFVRINRFHIINTEKVRQAQQFSSSCRLILQSGKEFSISRRYLSQLAGLF